MTTGSAVAPETTWRDGLPPSEYWVMDRSRSIPTPVDERGLIVVDELIEAVKAYIDPEYRWDGPNDVHHLYFYAALYEIAELKSGGQIPARRFRELPANKLLIPRRFHNVIHAVTEPAPMPSPEVMADYIEAWTVARNLFASVRNTVRTERLARRWLDNAETTGLTPEQAQVGREIMEEVLMRHFRGIVLHLGQLALLPEDLRPLDPDDDVHSVVSQLGQIFVRGHQRLTRAVRLKPDGSVA